MWSYFPKGLSVVSICSESTGVCFLTWIWYLLKCLPSPVGILTLSASEAPPSVCSTADSKDTFVTTHSSKASKDCPVGFADFGSVSVAYLQFSVGSSIFVCMSYWSYDVILHIVELKAQRCQLSVTGSYSVNFPSHSAFSTRSQDRHVYWLLTNNWQTIRELFKSLVWKENTSLHDWLGQSWYFYIADCCLRPPGKGACMLAVVCGFDRKSGEKLVNLPGQVALGKHFSTLEV